MVRNKQFIHGLLADGNLLGQEFQQEVGLMRMTGKLSRRLAYRPRKHSHLPILFALVLAAGIGLLTGAGIVRAQASNTFSTTTAIPAGAVMTTSVTTGGVTITGSTPISGCPTTGIGTATVTYTCSSTSSGISIGTPIIQTFSGTTGAINLTVTYNANGPITGYPGVTAPSTNPGNCTNGGPPPATVSCGAQTTAEVVPTGVLNVTVTGAGGQSVQITAAPATLGTCPLTSPLPSGTAAAPTPVTVAYTCASGQTVPQGTNTSLTVQTTVAAGTPTTSAVANAIVPIAATPSIPSPTTQPITIGSGTPSVEAISPPNGAPGTFVTVSGTNLATTSAINFGSTPGTGLNCIPGGTSCTVTAPFASSGATVPVTVVTPSGTSSPVTFIYSGTSGGGTGITVSYASGWNIVAGPTGTVIPGALGPLYTYQAGNTAYQTIQPGAQLTAGQGYWAYFSVGTSGIIPVASGQTITVSLPAGNWIMIGNPGNTAATVTGADIVYTFNGTYQTTTTLLPGQGGWAISVNGGTATIRNQ
jgi:hypothetical protein